jgi:hypothetical protein
VALNLWKIGGKPTSYNPLPTGWTEVSISGYKSYTMTFRAKSASSASITLYARMGNELVKTINLTPVLTTYSASVDVVTSNLFSIFNTNATDIIIDSIELVQKPLPKLTLNGVDGFMSGKWGTSSHGTVIDDMTYSLNATVAYENITCVVPVLPNTTYSFSLSWSGNTPAPRVQLLDVNGNDVGNPVNGGANNSGNFSASFTTTSTTVNVRIYAQANSAGLVTFKNLMLNLGSTPAPYSRKTGDKMVLPVARKNLFNKDGLSTSGYDLTGTLLPIRNGIDILSSSNKTYTLSGCAISVHYSFWAGSTFISGGATDDKVIFTTPSGCTKIHVALHDTLSNPNTVQLEEGTSSTAYTPYDVQGNKKAKKYVPNKNYFDKTTALLNNFLYADTGVITSSGQSNCVSDFINIKPNTKYYALNIRTNPSSSGSIGACFYDNAKNYISGVIYGGSSLSDFISPSNAYYVKFTFYYLDIDKVYLSDEQYRLVTPKARTGLVFKGSSSITVPNVRPDAFSYVLTFSTSSTYSEQILYLKDFGSPWNKLSIYGGKIRFTLTTSTGTKDLDSVNSFNDGRKHTVIAKYDGVNMLIYVDGVLEVTFPKTGIPTYGINNSVYVGDTSFDGVLYNFSLLDGIGLPLLKYDFENPSNIVGSTVLQGANNLIPNFDDARWSLHANTQVLGKHLLRLNAQTSSTDTFINIPVKNGAYKFSINTNGLFRVYKGFITNTFSSYVVVNDNGTLGNLFTVDDSFNGYITLRLTSGAIGTFDFSKIQLYALSGAEGTINGTPTSARKQSRRTQYAKR